MRFQLLGPLSITDGRDVAVLPPSKPTSLLAALLLRPGSIVSAERLRGVVWGEEHPPTAKTALQSCVLRLRRLFAKYGIENQAIVAVAGGYRVDADAETLDLLHFRRLVEHATASDPESELYTLRTALGLWQGALLANVPSDLLHRDEVPRLSEERLRVLERVCDIELEHDRCREALVDLWEVTRVYPAHERFAEQLMVALYRTGRQTEALAEYRRIKEHLRERLGVDPRAELQRLELAILRGEDLGPVDTARGPLRLGATRGPLGQGAGHGTPGPGAAHGPLSPHGAREPLPLGTASDDAPSPSAYSPAASSPHSPAGSVAPPAYPSPGPVASAVPPGGVSVSPLGPSATSGAPSAGARPSGVSTGAGGRAPSSAAASTSPLPTVPHFTGRAGEVGALEALLTADRPAEGSERLPLAVLSGAPGIGKTALALHVAHRTARHFPGGCVLVALTEPDGTPRPAEEAAAELRRALPPGSEERGPVLLVLDDVVHPDQVRPLLTAHPDGAALVTSRMGLTGLVATHGGTVHRLGALEPEQSRALLTAVLGRERFAAEPAAAARLAGLCDGLPLALRVTAARLAERPRWTLDAMVGELADEQSRLSLLDIEDRGVSAALHLTLQQLPDSAARLFRAIGLHTGSDLDRFAASALAGTSAAQTSADLDRLAAAHLLTESVPGRWMPHDLVRLYARHLARQADPEGLHRLLDHYLYTGLAADAAAEPGSQPCYSLPADARRPAAAPEFEDRTAALDWYAAERAALEGAVTAAASLGLHDRAWRLAVVAWPLMLMRIGDGWTPLLDAGLASAEHLGDLDAQSRVRALLGWILHAEGRNAEALVHLEKATQVAARVGDPIGEAIAHVNYAAVLDATGEHERAGLLLLHALSLADRTGHPPTQVLALQHLAGYCLKAGDYEGALAHTLRAGELVPPDSVVVQAQLQIVRGEALAGSGRLEEAADQLERAIAASEAAGFPEGSARAAARLSRLAADR
ncbi:hypothetical protein BU196_14665 [Streptomyces sp. CBMA370]|nr:hypothetical protein [Streptomyces sp. CBMA370]